MVHEELLSILTCRVPIEYIRHVHQGNDPMEFDLKDEQVRTLLNRIQAGFVEQELNWGDENFQLWTYFGNGNAKDALLRSSAPRDFQMVYVERCHHEHEVNELDEDALMEPVLKPFIKVIREAGNKVLFP